VSYTLLCSAQAQEFQPCGINGEPLCRSAEALRATIAEQIGADAAHCLAQVQPEPNGEQFDWYAPFDGHVMAWADACSEERSNALARLEALHRQFLAAAQQIEANADASAAQRLFAKQLRLAVHFPGNEQLYLVDSKLVVTF